MTMNNFYLGQLDFAPKLIELVKRQPPLYDIRDPAYTDTWAKEIIWNDIASILKIDCDRVKRRWKSLRGVYTKILSSQSTNIKPWRYSELMEPFRECFLMSPKLIHTMKKKEMSTKKKFELKNPDVVKLEEVYILQSSPNSHVETLEDLSDNFEEEPIKIENNINDNMAIIPNLNLNNLSDDVVVHVEEKGIKNSKLGSISKYLNEKSYDATDLIFLGYAQTLKSFSPSRQASLKMKIAKLIAQHEIKHIRQNKKNKKNALNQNSTESDSELSSC